MAQWLRGGPGDRTLVAIVHTKTAFALAATGWLSRASQCRH